MRISFLIQVDTLAHKIPNFIEKAARAGCRYAFIGLESINPDNLIQMKKNQNRITEYRKMFQAWKNAGMITYAGFILGLPGDTPASVKRDIEIIQKELPVDLLEFTMLTPLPGSEDHQKLHDKGVWMDPDLNKYDLETATVEHPLMSRDEWQQTYWDAWNWYYSDAARRTDDAPQPRLRDQPGQAPARGPPDLRRDELRGRAPAAVRLSPPQGENRAPA